MIAWACKFRRSGIGAFYYEYDALQRLVYEGEET